jgi:hypothetical protein
MGAAAAQRPGAEGAQSGDTASFDLPGASAPEKATVPIRAPAQPSSMA